MQGEMRSPGRMTQCGRLAWRAAQSGVLRERGRATQDRVRPSHAPPLASLDLSFSHYRPHNSKQEEIRKGKWNKRFFVLHQTFLEYFESDKVLSLFFHLLCLLALYITIIVLDNHNVSSLTYFKYFSLVKMLGGPYH